jgi:hypothetical protein
MALAAEAWAALRRAGTRLKAEGEALALYVPEHAEPAPLVALARRAGAHLWPLASGRWRAELARWPEAMREAWAERAALREFEGRQPREEAEQAAFLDERERALRPHADTLAALARELGAVLIAVEAAPVASLQTPDREPPDGLRPTSLPPAPWPRLCRACGQRALERAGCARCGARPPPAAPP